MEMKRHVARGQIWNGGTKTNTLKDGKGAKKSRAILRGRAKREGYNGKKGSVAAAVEGLTVVKLDHTG